MAQTYYSDATAILIAYLGCAPEKRITFVREMIGSQDPEVDLTKVWKAVDTILLTLEKTRGQLASQLAISYGTIGSPAQLALFGATARTQRLEDAAQQLMTVGEGRLSVNLTTGEIVE